ncbi:uncharacterized protein [Spinacia oleracea]|uniref:Avr9/Cf-9 rapidly elicited protein 146 n=1 Tax=Spinacia oleracea TaxID=3562 RepID=A0A9R0IPX8_SPIOL|nr:uncharacterized protein LOC110792893 [Spinacia oleracea]
MEPNIAGISKKVWNIVRVAIFMIKKGLCKRKLFMDLNLMMKRGKLAGKALGKNLMFHHHHHHKHDEFTSQVGLATPTNNDGGPPREYEFSCSNTPLYRHYFTNKNKKNKSPKYLPLEDGENVNLEDVNNVLQMMLRDEEVTGVLAAASPVLPGLGYGRSPAVRQLRITDSPFPVKNSEEDNKHVDLAAEAFINKFYSQLKQQKYY